MTEKPLPPLMHMLFCSEAINLEAYFSNNSQVTQTAMMLRDAVSYGLYNYIYWQSYEAEHPLGYQLRVMGPSLDLGVIIKEQQELQIESAYNDSGWIPLTDLDKFRIMSGGLIPINSKEIENLILNYFSNKKNVSVTMERRVFELNSLDLEDFKLNIIPLIDYLEIMYDNLSLPLVNPVRAYLERISSSIQTERIEYLEDNSETESPVPLLDGQLRVERRDDKNLERAQTALENALGIKIKPKLNTRNTIPGMPTVNIVTKPKKTN